jgi:aryl-alcohol dehydrogenase-like predicted oxidoreductase
MNNSDNNLLKISSFTLGTAQLGLPYGIANRTGKPDRRTAVSILKRAEALGVNSFDTAAGYGDAEEVIGEWLRSRKNDMTPIVTTKISSIQGATAKDRERNLRIQVENSKQRLGLDRIPVLMLHRFDDFSNDPKGITEVFRLLKMNGDIHMCGISLYENDDYAMIADSEMDVVQVPLNILDWRLMTSGKLKLLMDAKKNIFVRSVFLQGLIFMSPDELSNEMAFCKPVLEKLAVLCQKYQLPPAELAISAVLSLPGIASVVIGCETMEQVELNAGIISRSLHLKEKQIEGIMNFFKEVDSRVIDPRLWRNRLR